MFKKKIYDEATEDMFDMSNVRISKKLRRKNGECLYFAMSSISLAQYSVWLKESESKKNALRPNAVYLNS